MSKTRRQRIEEMLADDPNDPFLRYCLAMDYAGAGDYSAAGNCFLQLLEHSPDYVPAYLHAAKVLQQLGSEDQAREVARRGVAAARGAGDEHAAGELEFFLDAL
jgi:cytochrome c-type biogenesis protein CcmH/NrfG